MDDTRSSRLGFVKVAGSLFAAGVGAAAFPTLASAGRGLPDDRPMHLEADVAYRLVARPAGKRSTAAAAATQAICCPTGAWCVDANGGRSGWANRCSDRCGDFFYCTHDKQSSCFPLPEPGC